MRDMVFAAPPVALLGRLAAVFKRLGREHRGVAAFATAVLTIFAGIAGVVFGLGA